MDQNKQDLSRIDRYEKKRKSTRLITRFSVILGILVVALIGTFLFGGNSENQAQTQTDPILDSEQKNAQIDTAEAGKPAVDEEGKDESPADEAEKEKDDLKKQTVESSDPNVTEAYTANWKPVGTQQSEPHTVVIKQGTQEWTEIMEAVSLATGLSKDDVIAWWVTRGGAQEVIATVSDGAETKTFRVYLHWVENEGYRPDKVEILKENDQKYRFQ